MGVATITNGCGRMVGRAVSANVCVRRNMYPYMGTSSFEYIKLSFLLLQNSTRVGARVCVRTPRVCTT